MKYSIIIPTYYAQETLIRIISSTRRAFNNSEIIIVDGGSHDKTVSLAEACADEVVVSKKGRGIQMNKGVERATGDMLVFLHADTILPRNAEEILEAEFSSQQIQIGTFRMRFDKDHWLLNFYGKLTKFDSLWTRFGDQCIVMRRSFFDQIGGYPNWPLFEDVRLLQEARRQTRIYSFPGNVVTSASKYLENGILNQQLKNGWLILLYLLGVSPYVLSKKYSV